MSVEITKLGSGLTIVTDTMASVESASLGIHIAAGARSEAANEHGLAHLLEHMAFKGTKRRSAKAIAEEIEAVGGDLNAATSVETTAYYARMLKADMPLALDILADILTESVFDETELEREKNVIVQEIGAVEDTPDDLVYDMLAEASFPGQSVGRRILGTPETVTALDRQAIAGYLSTHYAAPSMIVSAAGAVDHDAIAGAATRLFERLPVTASERPNGAHYVGGETLAETDHEQANVILGFEGIAATNPDMHAFALFTAILGGGMSSRLFQEVREERGLCYAIHAFQWGLTDSGSFGIYASASADDLPKLMPVIVDTLKATAASASEAELQRARAQMRAGILMSQESSAARSEHLARQLIYFGKTVTATEIVAKIDAVSLDDVRRVGQRVALSVPTLAAIGPVSKLPGLDVLAAQLRAG